MGIVLAAWVGCALTAGEEGEKDRFHRALDGLRPRLAELGVGLPETIELVKTTGGEVEFPRSPEVLERMREVLKQRP